MILKQVEVPVFKYGYFTGESEELHFSGVTPLPFSLADNRSPRNHGIKKFFVSKCEETFFIC